jgi:hypothetical protein
MLCGRTCPSSSKWPLAKFSCLCMDQACKTVRGCYFNVIKLSLSMIIYAS